MATGSFITDIMQVRAVTVGNIYILPGSEFVGNVADLEDVSSIIIIDHI